MPSSRTGASGRAHEPAHGSAGRSAAKHLTKAPHCPPAPLNPHFLSCARSSHGSSWHDDAQQKFDAVQAWRARFVNAHGREPTVWFDALCIDQDNVQPQLASLPIYLAGCKTVLALAGPTYFQRLWCVLELHIFHQMGGSIEQIHFVPLETVAPTAGDVGAEEAANEAAVFDVRCAVATDPLDELRLLAVIEGSGEGIAAFNSWVRTTLMSAAKVRH